MWLAKQPANLDVEVKQSAQSIAWQLFCLSHALASSNSAPELQKRDGSRSQAEDLRQRLQEVGQRPMPGRKIRKLLLRANATAERLAHRILKLAHRKQRRLRKHDPARALIEITAAHAESSQARLQAQRKHLRRLTWPRRMFLAAEGFVAAAAVSAPVPVAPVVEAPADTQPAAATMTAPAVAAELSAPAPTMTAALRGTSKVTVPRQRIP